MTVEEDIIKAADILKSGGVILYPTDTIWGIGCDATNSVAVERIFQIKEREDCKALLSIVENETMLKSHLRIFPTAARNAICLADTPITIIYDSPSGIAENLKAPDGSAAFRITSDCFVTKLCTKLGKPLVSTSANISGEPSPHTFNDIDSRIIKAVDYVCRYGRDKEYTKPSRILKISDTNIVTIIRE